MSYTLSRFTTPNKSARVGSPIYLCVHSTEGSTLAGAQAVFQSSAAQASCDEIISTNGKQVAVCNRPRTKLKTWQVGDANSLVACGYESVGFANHTIWPDNFYATMADRMVRAQAETLKTYGVKIPLRRSTTKGVKGIVRHLDLAQWYGGSDHTDPGNTFDWDKLDAAIQNRKRPVVRFRYAVLNARNRVIATFADNKKGRRKMKKARWGAMIKKFGALRIRREKKK